MPRGYEREVVQDDRERLYELNREDSRMLTTIGVFRVVRERDMKDCRDAEDSLDHLRDQGLIRSVQIDANERGDTLSERGRDLLEAHQRDRDDDDRQSTTLA